MSISISEFDQMNELDKIIEYLRTVNKDQPMSDSMREVLLTVLGQLRQNQAQMSRTIRALKIQMDDALKTVTFYE